MKLKKQLVKMVFGLVIMSLVATSFGGAWATAAYAASPEEETAVENDGGNAAIGGILALGLIAVLAGGKKGGGSKTPAKATGTAAPAQPAAGATTANTTNTGSVATKPTATTTTAAGLSSDEAKAFQLLNADRAANGLPTLKVNMNLVHLAENYGQDMINRNYFSHYNPEGQSPFDRMTQAGISYRYAGENLAINSSVPAAENAFMNSSGHRANILSPNYTEVGVGVRKDAAGSVYVVQEFISQ